MPQGQLKGFELGLRAGTEIGQGTFFYLALVAIGLAQQDAFIGRSLRCRVETSRYMVGGIRARAALDSDYINSIKAV